MWYEYEARMRRVVVDYRTTLPLFLLLLECVVETRPRRLCALSLSFSYVPSYLECVCALRCRTHPGFSSLAWCLAPGRMVDGGTKFQEPRVSDADDDDEIL